MGLLYCYCTDLRDIKKIVDDHLNIRVYRYIFLVFFLLSFIYFFYFTAMSTIYFIF